MTETERELIIHQHVDLVKYEVDRVAAGLPEGVDRDDLVSAGIIGLIRAVDRFDPQRGASFATYATSVMRGAIMDELRTMDWAPRGLRSRYRRLEETIGRLRQELGRQPQETEIAQELGVNTDEYTKLLTEASATAIVSLDSLVEVGGDAYMPGARQGRADTQDLTCGRPEWDPAAAVDSAELRRLLAEVITELSEREQLVISLYYDEELTLQEIGAVLGVTESRVCQIHTQAIARLRAGLFGRIGG
jgi:RNA polymerase sigma factor for flagellar operon FliA